MIRLVLGDDPKVAKKPIVVFANDCPMLAGSE
jgi:hypothetical protein